MLGTVLLGAESAAFTSKKVRFYIIKQPFLQLNFYAFEYKRLNDNRLR